MSADKRKIKPALAIVVGLITTTLAVFMFKTNLWIGIPSWFVGWGLVMYGLSRISTINKHDAYWGGL